MTEIKNTEVSQKSLFRWCNALLRIVPKIKSMSFYPTVARHTLNYFG
jgi:TorA maturation chaperone TorD